MRGHCNIHTIAFLVTAFWLSPASAPGAQSAADSAELPGATIQPTPRGISFLAGRATYFSSLTSDRIANYDAFIGVGYNVTPKILIALKILTGREKVDASAGLPVDGSFDLGGADLEATYRMVGEGRLRPYCSAAIGLSTILSGESGYQGRSVRMEAGEEYFAGDHFALQLGAWFRYRDYDQSIDQGAFGNSPSVSPDRAFGITLQANVHFNIVP